MNETGVSNLPNNINKQGKKPILKLIVKDSSDSNQKLDINFMKRLNLIEKEKIKAENSSKDSDENNCINSENSEKVVIDYGKFGDNFKLKKLIESYDPAKNKFFTLTNESQNESIKNESSIESSNNYNFSTKMRKNSNLTFPINEVLKNKNLDEEQIEEIREYLFTQFNYRNISLTYNDELHYLAHLDYFIPFLFLEIYQQNKLIQKYQEKSNSIYYLLEGHLDIMAPKPAKIDITPQDYLMFLSYLRKHKEENLLRLIVETNNNEVFQSNLILAANANMNNNYNNQSNGKKTPTPTNQHHLNINNNFNVRKDNETKNIYNFCLGQLQQFINAKKEIKRQYKEFIINSLKKYQENRVHKRYKDNIISPHNNFENSKDINNLDRNNNGKDYSKNANYLNIQENALIDNKKKSLVSDNINKKRNSNESKNNTNNRFNISITNKFHDAGNFNSNSTDKNQNENNQNNTSNNAPMKNLLQTIKDLENDIHDRPKHPNRLVLNCEQEDFLENLDKVEIFKKENLNFVRKCIFDNFTNFNSSIMRILQKDYFYRSFNNFYVLSSGNFKRRRIVNVRIRIKDCICRTEKEKMAFKKQDKEYPGYLKLNFRIDLEKLEEKIFKNKSKKQKDKSIIKDMEHSNYNENHIPDCAMNEKEKKPEKAQEMRIISNISSYELARKFNFTTAEISDFFISNFSEENESNILKTETSQNSGTVHTINSQNPIRNSFHIDLFNEDFSEDDQEGETIDIQNVQKLLFKLKERYKIIKIPFEIFEYNLIKSLKRGEIIGNINDKLKCFPTIITKQETFFLKIKKDVFESTLDEMNKTSIFKTLTNFALSPIFKDLLKTQFYKLFYKKLSNYNLHKNEKVIKEGDYINDLFFIKEGSFVIKIKKSIIEINEIIKTLTKKNTCENEELENDKIIDSDKFKEFMNKKFVYRIINSNASKCPKVEINRSRYAELKKDTIVKRLIDLKISKIYEYERNNKNSMSPELEDNLQDGKLNVLSMNFKKEVEKNFIEENKQDNDLVAAARIANFKRLKRKQNKDLKLEIDNMEVEMENEKKKIKRNNKPYYTEENFSDKRKKNQTYKKFVDIKAADEKIGIPNEEINEKNNHIKKLVHAGKTKLFFFDHLSDKDKEDNKSKRSKSKNDSNMINEDINIKKRDDVENKLILNPKTVNFKILNLKNPSPREKNIFQKTDNKIFTNTKSALVLKKVKVPNLNINDKNINIHKIIKRNRSVEMINNAKLILDINNFNSLNNNQNKIFENNDNQMVYEFNANLINQNISSKTDKINLGLEQLKQTIRSTKIIFPYLNFNCQRDFGTNAALTGVDNSKTKTKIFLNSKEILNNSNMNNITNNSNNNFTTSNSPNVNNSNSIEFGNSNYSPKENNKRKIIKLNRNKTNFLTASSPLGYNTTNSAVGNKKNQNSEFFLSSYNKKTLNEKFLHAKSTKDFSNKKKMPEKIVRTENKLQIYPQNLNGLNQNDDEKSIKSPLARNEFNSIIENSEKENDRNNTNSHIQLTDAVCVTTNENEDLNGISKEKEDFSTQTNIMSNGNFVNRSKQKSNTNKVYLEKNITFNVNERRGFNTVRIYDDKTLMVTKLPKINSFGLVKKDY